MNIDQMNLLADSRLMTLFGEEVINTFSEPDRTFLRLAWINGYLTGREEELQKRMEHLNKSKDGTTDDTFSK